MIHCSLCHQDYEKYFEHKKVCPGKLEVDCEKCGTIAQQKFRKFIEKESDRRGGLKSNDGVFGEYLNRGFVEEEGENWTKYYGCSYINPIRVENEVIDRVATFKRTILYTARYMPFVFLFNWQRWLLGIAEADLVKHIPKKWNRVAYEVQKGLKTILPDRLAECIAMIPNYDSGYLFRIQDWIILAKKYGIDKAFRLAIQRETGGKGLKWKYDLFWLGSFFIRRKIKKFLKAIDTPYPTEADRYFAYRRSGYDFEGIPFKERAKWAEDKDREKGHVILGNEINV